MKPSTPETHAAATAVEAGTLPPGLTAGEVLRDYRIGARSRQASLLGRREVLTGKAKFGIFGDGKEVAQLAWAHAIEPGDFRSGYYRDQTLAMALGWVSVEQFFAQLYADPEVERDPHSAGRSMSAHFGTRLLDAGGQFRNLLDAPQTSSDISPTGSQMPRLVGLAQASKLYRELRSLDAVAEKFSRQGREIAWGTIGNASCAEGMFWESINAAGVLRVPMIVSIWDDGYGISVPNEHQVTKSNVGELLEGFRRQRDGRGGYEIETARGWDFPALVAAYRRLADLARREHVPGILHVIEMTQPQGHSTSGSHERYKSKERLAWEERFDPLRRMRQWMLDTGIATAAGLDAIEAEEAASVRDAQRRAWEAFRAPIARDVTTTLGRIDALAQGLEAAAGGGGSAADAATAAAVRAVADGLRRNPTPLRRDAAAAASEALVLSHPGVGTDAAGRAVPPSSAARQAREALSRWRHELDAANRERYATHLHSETPGERASDVAVVSPAYAADAPVVNGSEILNACFDAALERDPRLVAFGEDLGFLGDVNQGFAGLQAKHGPLRVADTGIRETTIIGQAIGLALRGLRPLAEVQYLDYILYCLQILSDDLATLRWRTAGGQKAPVIVRTRGHRLEGIWHSGSPMAGVLHLVRGLHFCVPRNMTQAAGMYNTLWQTDEPAIVVEVLNAYRSKERLPANIGAMTVPLGVPEILRPGTDATVVTYGACCRIVLEAADLLDRVGISIEVVDVQTLLPFDTGRTILASVQKTNRLLVVDEDVPGGASAYLAQQIVDGHGAFHWLDAPPRALSAEAHRPAYGSDGDYWSKPNRETVVEAVWNLVKES